MTLLGSFDGHGQTNPRAGRSPEVSGVCHFSFDAIKTRHLGLSYSSKMSVLVSSHCVEGKDEKKRDSDALRLFIQVYYFRGY